MSRAAASARASAARSRAVKKGVSRQTLVATFQRLIDNKTLTMPDIELACIQLYALVLYPHLVHSAYGQTLNPPMTRGLINTGVDMFLNYYNYRPATTTT